MIEETFSLYEQTVADTHDYYDVHLTYEAKTPGKTSDYHGIHLDLKRPDEDYSFAEIVIERRNGQLSILVWPQPETIGNDPIIYHPNPDNSPYCLKCGWNWSAHENGCPQE